MSEEELYKTAISNVHRYSLLNEILSIRDNRYPNEETNYTINVNGYISLDVLNRYVRNIDELVKYQNIDTINNLKKLQQEKQDLISYLEDKIKECYKHIKEGQDEALLITFIWLYQEILDKITGGNNER